MKTLIAPDKFKGSLSAEQVCAALKQGIQKKFPSAEVISIPMADGGEGTCELLTKFFGGNFRQLEITGPLFEKIPSEYGIDKRGTTAYIEMAKASGLQLVKNESRNPLYTTTFGTGELIRDAIDQGVRKIIMGIGGSGTTDAGMGMAEALGYEFFDSVGRKLKPVGENLIHLVSIRSDHIHPELKKAKFVALCDVDNPLYGPNGAAYVYSPQKGANEKAVGLLDRGLRNFEEVVKKTFGISANFPGAGAGGGLAGGAKVFFNLSIHRGMDYIIQATQLAEKIRQADLIITGEGKIDSQTLAGKVVMAVAQLANRFGKPVTAFCGRCELTPDELRSIGISKVISLTDSSTSSEEAMRNAFELIEKRVAENF